MKSGEIVAAAGSAENRRPLLLCWVFAHILGVIGGHRVSAARYAHLVGLFIDRPSRMGAKPFHKYLGNDRETAPTSPGPGMGSPTWHGQSTGYAMLATIAYWLPFEHPQGRPGPRFLPNTSFDTVTAYTILTVAFGC